MSAVDDYVNALPPDRRAAIAKVREVIRANLPAGFEEGIQFKMIGYYVPLARYPDTYNKLPLCVAALSSQKQYMAVYPMSVYVDGETKRWFDGEYAKSGKKLDMGKACLRFKRLDDLALDVLGKTIARFTVDEYIARHEASRAGLKKKAPAKKTAAKKAPAKKKTATRSR